MNFNDRFFKLRLKLTDVKLRLKRAIPALTAKLKSVRADDVKHALRSAVLGVKPLFTQTPADLRDWTVKTDKVRFSVFFILLSVVFVTAGSFYAFLADDAFITFRYVSNAVKGWGYTFNPPPFDPVSGFTGILWMTLLRALWMIGVQPPYSANLMTNLFSMAQVWMCFLFVRRMAVQPVFQRKSLYLFLIVCLILLTNKTFLEFMTSGTEAALFNFLALWWTFEATSDKTRNPLWLAVSAVLLALCRFDGAAFIPASAVFLCAFLFTGRSKLLCLTGLAVLGTPLLYCGWLEKVYGDAVPNAVSVLFTGFFPAIGRDYALSFVLEYALYFWSVFFLPWAAFKFGIRRQKGFAVLFLLILSFVAYVGVYLFAVGADTLEYRPFGFFIPLFALAGVKMLTENICRSFKGVLIIVCAYLLVGTAIPSAHASLTKDLNTRRETAFLYRPVAQKAGWRAFFAKQWDEAQKRLIYQGAALRWREHKVLTEELLKTFPARADGERVKKDAYRLFAWDFVGVAGWTLPETFIIDLSGRSNIIAAKSPLKYETHRLLGHERAVPDGYVRCFNGGSNIAIDPFSGKKNLRLLRAAPLTEGRIKGCEGFWKSQIGASKPKPLRAPLR